MQNSVWDKIFYQEDGTKRALANILLVLLNVVIWCVMDFFGDTLDGGYIAEYGGLHPDLVMDGGEWFRLFTAMFLHFGIQHLANNMILLAAAGAKLEEAVGALRYLIIYVGAGIIGNILSLSVMMYTCDYAVCAGASGAVFGVIGALVWAAVQNRGKINGLTAKGLLFMTVLCLYNGLTTTGVDNWAHVGGAAGGFFLCILLYRKPQET